MKRMRSKSKFSFAFIGMIIAHLGIAVFVLGATVTTQLGIEKDIKMNVGETQNIAGYDFVFNGVSPHQKIIILALLGILLSLKMVKKCTA